MNDTTDTPDTSNKNTGFLRHLRHLDYPLVVLVAASMNCLLVFITSFLHTPAANSLIMLNLAHENRWLMINTVIAVIALYVLLSTRYAAFLVKMPRPQMLLVLLLSSAAATAIALGMAHLSAQTDKMLKGKSLENAGLSYCTDVYVSYRILDVDGMHTAPSIRRALYSKSCERIFFAQSGSGHGFVLDVEKTLALFQEDEARTQAPRYNVCIPERGSKGLNGVPANMDMKFLDTVIIAQQCTPEN